MKKDYQTKTAAVAIAVEAVMPDAVSVTLAELAGSLREGLLALAVGAGFQVMDAIIAENVSALAGPGEVLVTSTVKDLVIGSELQFDDRGAQTLKGVPGDWHLWAAN